MRFVYSTTVMCWHWIWVAVFSLVTTLQLKIGLFALNVQYHIWWKPNMAHISLSKTSYRLWWRSGNLVSFWSHKTWTLVSELCFIPITTDSYWWELGHSTGQWSHTQSKSITESLKKKEMRVLQWSKVHQVHYQSLFSFGLESLYFRWKQFW